MLHSHPSAEFSLFDLSQPNNTASYTFNNIWHCCPFLIVAAAVAVVIFTKHFQYPCKCSCFLLIVFLLAKIEWQ